MSDTFNDLLKSEANEFEKPAHEYWYNFGSIHPYPMRIDPGTLPQKPYRKFDTNEECQTDINSLNFVE